MNARPARHRRPSPAPARRRFDTETDLAALRAALAAAMAKSGESPSAVRLFAAGRQEAWGNASGFVVESLDAGLHARAVTFVKAWIAAKRLTGASFSFCAGWSERSIGETRDFRDGMGPLLPHATSFEVCWASIGD